MGNEIPLQDTAGEVAERVRELVRQTSEAFAIGIVRGTASKDHVRILVGTPPNLAPSEIMRRIMQGNMVVLAD